MPFLDRDKARSMQTKRKRSEQVFDHLTLKLGQWRIYHMTTEQNPFLSVRGAGCMVAEPYYGNEMIDNVKSSNQVCLYVTKILYLTMTLQRCIHVSNITCFPPTLDFPWLRYLLQIEKDNISEYCLSSSYFVTVPRRFGFQKRYAK